MTANGGYARLELLAEPDWLWERREDPRLRLIDCGSAEAYARAHIPSAVGLPVHAWIKDPADDRYVMEPGAFGELARSLGISDDTTVVTYAESTMLATRLWWVLNYYGHEDVKVLNGGWRRWLTEERPVTFKPTTPEPAAFTPQPNETLICRLDDVRGALDDPAVQILDVRPETWWRGTENPFGNKRVGHVPGSRNVDSDLFVTDDDRAVFKPAKELGALLAAARISPERETIVHCQAGIRTTHGVFALALLGFEKVRAYDASMGEWANRDDTPLVEEEALVSQ